MTKHCKFWLCFIAGALAVLAVLVLILSQAQRIKATSSPPPGPHQAGDGWVADLRGRTTMEMVWCPPGKFLMGSPVSEAERGPNETQHEVTLTQGFWLGKTEVTQSQWSAVMGTHPANFPEKEIIRWKVWKWEIPVWRKDFLARRWRLPVEQVSWNDCQEFCRNAGDGCRLPTEAEWEYACRAGGPPLHGSGILKDLGWYGDNSGDKTHPVGKKQPNAWSLYDMHGNVWEWCQDYYDGRDYPAGAATDPTGPAAGVDRAFRGGGLRNPSGGCRSALRNWSGPSHRSGGRGFRVVLPAVRP